MKGFLLWVRTVTIGVLTILVLLLGTVYWQMMTTDHHAEEAAKGELYLTYFDYDEFYGAERQSPRERAAWHMTAHGRRWIMQRQHQRSWRSRDERVLEGDALRGLCARVPPPAAVGGPVLESST